MIFAPEEDQDGRMIPSSRSRYRQVAASKVVGQVRSNSAATVRAYGRKTRAVARCASITESRVGWGDGKSCRIRRRSRERIRPRCSAPPFPEDSAVSTSRSVRCARNNPAPAIPTSNSSRPTTTASRPSTRINSSMTNSTCARFGSGGGDISGSVSNRLCRSNSGLTALRG